MTNLDLISELRRPGKFYVPVRGRDIDDKPNVYYVAIEKKDLIAHLQGFTRSDDAEWKIGKKYLDGHKLEVA